MGRSCATQRTHASSPVQALSGLGRRLWAFRLFGLQAVRCPGIGSAPGMRGIPRGFLAGPPARPTIGCFRHEAGRRPCKLPASRTPDRGPSGFSREEHASACRVGALRSCMHGEREEARTWTLLPNLVYLFCPKKCFKCSLMVAVPGTTRRSTSSSRRRRYLMHSLLTPK